MIRRAVALACALLAGTGCIRQRLIIRSNPAGAQLFINDQTAGNTPYDEPFLWYGWYRLTLLKLMERGLSRTQAYEMVQRVALAAWKNGRDFPDALAADRDIRKHLKASELRASVNPERHLKHVDEIFERVGL